MIYFLLDFFLTKRVLDRECYAQYRYYRDGNRRRLWLEVDELCSSYAITAVATLT